MRKITLRFDVGRNCWIHEPSGILISNWDDADPSNLRSKIEAFARQHIQARLDLKTPFEVVFDESNKIDASGTATTVKMTSFGQNGLPAAS